MRTWLYNIVLANFDLDELEEAVATEVAERIDYQEIAESLLDGFDITEIAKEIAEDAI